MQQFPPYFGSYENQAQQQAQQVQGQDPQQQSSLSMNGANLAIYTSMQPLSVLAAAQKKEQEAQQQNSQQQLSDVDDMGAHGKPKRKQVKNACVNCQKACKKCDIGRPCQRCIKYGLSDTCTNSVRKERKKGVKRGPYKKRNKNGDGSATSSGASTPNMTSPMTTNMYAQNTGMRTTPTNSMPMHYQPFPTQGHYNPYDYTNNHQMMANAAYMVPTPATIQQMYPGNAGGLTYEATMNMIQQQQQQQQQQQPQVMNGAYRPQEQQQMQSPSNPVSVGTPNSATPVTTATTTGTDKPEDDDDEGSKLTILSQLCSAVLDRNDPPKQDSSLEEQQNQIKQEDINNQAPIHHSTPPPSRHRSRESSNDVNNNINNDQIASNMSNANAAITGASNPTTGTTKNNFGTDSPHAYVNGHLRANTGGSNNGSSYGTPGSSPADSPADPWAQQQVNQFAQHHSSDQ